MEIENPSSVLRIMVDCATVHKICHAEKTNKKEKSSNRPSVLPENQNKIMPEGDAKLFEGVSSTSVIYLNLFCTFLLLLGFN